MPVSKKRKTRKKTRPYPQKSKTTAPPKKISRQKILIYIISALMILSLMAGYLVSGTQRTVTPTPVPQSDNIIQETPAPDTQNTNTEAEPAPDSTKN